MSSMIMGVALTARDKQEGGSVYCEYHRCDQCGAEYRVYLKSVLDVEDAFQKIAKMLGNKKEQSDICFHCQNQVIADQSVLLPV